MNKFIERFIKSVNNVKPVEVEKKREITLAEAMLLKEYGFGAVCEDGQVVRFERED